MLQLTRDNTQLLLNDIWELPTERVEETVVAKLPAPKYRLPRARKVPEPKPMTKWQKFAQEKGIKKQKRDKKVFDKDLDVSIHIIPILDDMVSNYFLFTEMGTHLRLPESGSDS